ncbi:hypothetical protein NE237_000988 [Protea cynaroides]|uniref:Uncharacterized protein n=1 Tax=Protea cynaroides TaxID=273540 RepID=A0A9Q0QXZ7_9MAGN|nr:hypothetical protein NE237_000988 [Protea cynaroides]
MGEEILGQRYAPEFLSFVEGGDHLRGLICSRVVQDLRNFLFRDPCLVGNIQDWLLEEYLWQSTRVGPWGTLEGRERVVSCETPPVWSSLHCVVTLVLLQILWRSFVHV